TTDDTYYVPHVPDDVTSGTTYTVPVTVTNTTGVTLPASTWKLSYHWLLPDDTTEAGDTSNELLTGLPADLGPGASVTVQAQLKTPDITTGTQAGNIRAPTPSAGTCTTPAPAPRGCPRTPRACGRSRR